jgi:hypothetical protein
MNAATFPAPEPVALADALKWLASPDWCFELKADGKRARLAAGELRGRARHYRLPGEVPEALASCVFDGELCASTYYAFDLLEANGQDLQRHALRERRAVLLALQPCFPAWIKPIPTAPAGMAGGEYLQAVLHEGAEGVCAKLLSAAYGYGWHKAKRLETFDVVVISPPAFTRSVAIGQYSNGALVDCGKVSIFSLGTLDNLRPGDVLEIAAQGRTAKGKFREPRFLRLRPDKPATDCRIEKEVEP